MGGKITDDLDVLLEKVKGDPKYHGTPWKVARFSPALYPEPGFAYAIVPDNDRDHAGDYVLVVQYTEEDG